MTATTIVYNEGDTEIVEISLGTVSEERGCAVIVALIAAVAMMMSFPDLRLAGHGINAWFVLQAVLTLYFFAGGLVFVVRCLMGPIPVRISFAPDRLGFDSGRAGLFYLTRQFDGQDFTTISWLLRRRSEWVVRRQDLKPSECVLSDQSGDVHLSAGTDQYVVSLPVSNSTQSQIRSAIEAWIQGDPPGLTETLQDLSSGWGDPVKRA